MYLIRIFLAIMCICSLLHGIVVIRDPNGDYLDFIKDESTCKRVGATWGNEQQHPCRCKGNSTTFHAFNDGNSFKYGCFNAQQIRNPACGTMIYIQLHGNGGFILDNSYTNCQSQGIYKDTYNVSSNIHWVSYPSSFSYTGNQVMVDVTVRNCSGCLLLFLFNCNKCVLGKVEGAANYSMLDEAILLPTTNPSPTTSTKTTTTMPVPSTTTTTPPTTTTKETTTTQPATTNLLITTTMTTTAKRKTTTAETTTSMPTSSSTSSESTPTVETKMPTTELRAETLPVTDMASTEKALLSTTMDSPKAAATQSDSKLPIIIGITAAIGSLLLLLLIIIIRYCCGRKCKKNENKNEIGVESSQQKSTEPKTLNETYDYVSSEKMKISVPELKDKDKNPYALPQSHTSEYTTLTIKDNPTESYGTLTKKQVKSIYAPPEETNELIYQETEPEYFETEPNYEFHKEILPVIEKEKRPSNDPIYFETMSDLYAAINKLNE